MSVQHQERKFYTLTEIAKSIQNALKEKTEIEFWATAEIVKLGYYRQSGHCYPQLVEKRDNKVVAEMRGIIWKYDFFRINNKFKKITGSGIGEGISVFFKCHLKYDSLYGLSLHINDIDPVYTIGKMEQDRLECIKRLTKENIYTLNRQLPTPFLIKKLAVISVDSSKGYQDFQNIIESYLDKGLRLEYDLFPALLQGDRSIKSIMNQLDRIRVLKEYDAVAILRGGGGDVGLASYNDYELAKCVATFPLPVLTGIGHSTNETVTELVSHRYFITPTDLAVYIMDGYTDLAHFIESSKHILADTSRIRIKDEREKLLGIKQNMSAWSLNLLRHENEKIELLKMGLSRSGQSGLDSATTELSQLKQKLPIFAERPLHQQLTQLQSYRKTIEILDPQRLLERGFSMTYQEDKVLMSIDDLDPKIKIVTRLQDGVIKSIPLS